MNTTEAKFILHARRANGRDDADPRFTEALAAARQDPALAQWLAQEQAFDTEIAAKFRTVQPPVGLREAILAGARAGRRPVPFWRQGFLPVPATSPMVLVQAVPIRCAAW